MRTADNRRNLEHLANGVYAEVENGVDVRIVLSPKGLPANYSTSICLTMPAFEALVRYVNTHLKKENEE